MIVRIAAGGAFALAMLASSVTSAQTAWIPPKGEMAVAATYQWLEADRHLFSHLTDPQLTPLEVVRGIDYQSNSLDFGRVQSHAVVIDGDLGLTDHLAVNGALAFISPRYLGNFPHPGTADNGQFHATVQDLQLGARYMMGNNVWSVTPFSAFTTPVRHYEVLAHSAQGLRLRQLEFGMTAGRILLAGGAAHGYVEGGYGYSFVERTSEDVPLNRSRAMLEAGIFVGRFTVQGSTLWRRVHGGFEWSDVAFGSNEHFEGHDQSAATREWRYATGVSIQMTQGKSLEVSYGDLIKGANTHDAHVLSVGWTWGFQLFGGQTIGGAVK